MKNPTNAGFDQHDNVQLAVTHEALFIVGHGASAHPTDQAEVAPTVDSIPLALGTPDAAALDAGCFSTANIRLLAERGIEPYIATGRTPHHQGWRAESLSQPALPPPEDSSPKEHMADKLQTAASHAIYRLRKCTVEPVFGGSMRG
jgi:hypothetical protein